jgi:hypothetical protein
VVHLKAYVPRPPHVGPTPPVQIPDIIDDQEEYEVEEILSHRGAGARTQYLVRFRGYGPEDDLWLPQRNLKNAPDILKDYHDRQTGRQPVQVPRAQRAPRHLTRLGHVWMTR